MIRSGTPKCELKFHITLTQFNYLGKIFGIFIGSESTNSWQGSSKHFKIFKMSSDCITSPYISIRKFIY